MSYERVGISDLRYGLIQRDLLAPYVLSFRKVERIESVWVWIKDSNGHMGLGEAVPLPGYGQENAADILAFLAWFCRTCRVMDVVAVQSFLAQNAHKAPFAVSAIGAALDFRLWNNDSVCLEPLPLVFPIAAQASARELTEQVELGLAQGYRHFKVKTGRDVRSDIFTARYLLDRYSEECTFRFDANQAYTYDEVVTFCSSFEKQPRSSLLWLEQPLKADDWSGMERLCRVVDFPLMLDESIYDEASIVRARDIGCTAVKLKLFKHRGLESCLRLARCAASLDLTVTLGNGVSSDIGNLGEALVADRSPQIFSAALECNGYIKLRNHVAFPQLQLDNYGRLVWYGTFPVDLAPILAQLENASVPGSCGGFSA